MMQPSDQRRALLILSAIGALTPLAIDMYLPGLPGIASELGVSMQRMESSVSTYMLGLAIGVLFGASASDRLGRKPSLLCGLLLFVVCSLALAAVHDADLFLLLRVVQALGGGFVFVNVPAIVRDMYDEHDSAKAFTMITIIALMAPLLAPAMGSAVLEVASWRMIFVAMGAYALALFGLVALRLPETARPDPLGRNLGFFGQARANVRRVLTHREAVALTVCQGFVFAVLFSFVADASFAYMLHFGLNAWHFSLLFAANIITLMAFNRLNKHLLKRHRPFDIIPFGIAIQVVSSAALVATIALDRATLPVFVPLVMLGVGAHAMVTPNLVATFMARFTHGAGTASGVITGAQYFSAGVISIIAAALHSDTIQTTAVTMLLSALAAAAAFRVARRRRLERLAREARAHGDAEANTG